MNIPDIAIYGDSIGKGVLLDAGRYVVSDKWLSELSKETSLSIKNYSRFGATVDKGLRAIERCVYKGEPLARYTVVEFGGNDCDFNWAQVASSPKGVHLPNIEANKFSDMYLKMLGYIQESGSQPIMVNLVPVISSRYLAWICRNGLSKERILEWLGYEDIIFKFQQGYSKIVAQISAFAKVPLIDIRSLFLKHPCAEELICLDGIHPSSEGQKLIKAASGEFVLHQRELLNVSGAAAG